jgi:hypothetical protein
MEALSTAFHASKRGPEIDTHITWIKHRHTYCWGAAWHAAVVGTARTHVEARVCLQQQSHTHTH